MRGWAQQMSFWWRITRLAEVKKFMDAQTAKVFLSLSPAVTMRDAGGLFLVGHQPLPDTDIRVANTDLPYNAKVSGGGAFPPSA